MAPPAKRGNEKSNSRKTTGKQLSFAQAFAAQNKEPQRNDGWDHVYTHNATSNLSDHGEKSADNVSLAAISVHDTEALTESRMPDNEHTLDLSLLPKGWKLADQSIRDRRSWIWKHAHDVQDPNGKRYWLCKYCHKTRVPNSIKTHRYDDGTTSHQSKHLEKLHKIIKNGSKQTDFDDGTTLDSQVAVSLKRSHTAESENLKTAYINWVVLDKITLRQSVSESFKRLMTAANPNLAYYLPLSKETTRSWIIKSYQHHTTTICESIKSARSRISITFDGWKSDSGYDFLGVCFHYIDRGCKLQTVLGALTPIKGEKTGENQEAVITPVLRKYGINKDNIGWFVLDNATNNDTTMVQLGKNFEFDPAQRRLRCLGHSKESKSRIHGNVLNVCSH
jgi:hypothetical protein